MAGLGFDTGMETKQIFSIASDLKPRKKGVDYEINNYCATCRIKYPKDILTCSIANIESEQQVGIVVRKQIRKGFDNSLSPRWSMDIR
jgi:hypothetical protein